jgi:hypothetical protein
MSEKKLEERMWVDCGVGVGRRVILLSGVLWRNDVAGRGDTTSVRMDNKLVIACRSMVFLSFWATIDGGEQG